MRTTSEQMRAWTGPAVLSYGFRPFFLVAGLWAAAAMVAWIAMLSGQDVLPTAFDPVSWHAHEFLFGYLGAVVAGFMLAAVPNWTGRLPLVGWPLAGLFALWLAGRLAVSISEVLPALVVAAADLSFAVLLALAMTREIVAGRNWRNLTILALLATFILANGLFHWEAARGGYAAGSAGLRLGLAAGLMMIAVIGGRIIPSFTRNWLVKRGDTVLPTPPMQVFDKLTLLVLLGALLAWVGWPLHILTGGLLVAAGLLHLARLARWSWQRTAAEPLVWVLHLAYLFLPMGAVLQGLATLWPELIGTAPAQHVWMAGCIGLMTLAVMTRATLGHTGRALTADRGTTAIYLLVVAAVLLRALAGVWPAWASMLHALSAVFWIAAFGGFSLLYGGLLLRPKPAA
ncbi:NnrS family protein [Dinoroseobacter sp. PD6]|uniref:NnrS family protein n=1 Tax=Dinoroseobacter sp. PD6 TaxID=3028384 RepID=UPI00237A9367|nr:NnrS family protein [Dinoroseobacter sp. PD6]MDD9716451.1 NnrS family protein [Dinoroseobacter sp. PD6]